VARFGQAQHEGGLLLEDFGEEIRGDLPAGTECAPESRGIVVDEGGGMRIMKPDFSWGISARKYEEIYRRAQNRGRSDTA